MKKQLLIFSLIIACSANYLLGQDIERVVQGINYQAIARDTSGKELANKSINVKFAIRDSIPTGKIIWEEVHDSVQTNRFGLFTLVIGKTNLSIFTKPEWMSKRPHYLEVSINGQSISTTQFQAVPYAFAAAVAKSVVSDVLILDSTIVLSPPNTYSLEKTHSIVIVKVSGVSITLPSASSTKGKIYQIKNAVGGNLLNPITIVPSDGANIEGKTNYQLSAVSTGSASNSITIVSDGTDWWILAKN